MKRFISVAVLAAVPVLMRADSAASANLVQTSPAPAAQNHLRGYRWIRRASLAASCVAGTAVDMWALHHLASYRDVTLSGPFISNSKPNYGELIGIGAGGCALSTFLQERHAFARHETPGLDMMYTAENAGSLGVYMWATFHFLSLANQAAAVQTRTQPGTLATVSAGR